MVVCNVCEKDGKGSLSCDGEVGHCRQVAASAAFPPIGGDILITRKALTLSSSSHSLSPLSEKADYFINKGKFFYFSWFFLSFKKATFSSHVIQWLEPSFTSKRQKAESVYRHARHTNDSFAWYIHFSKGNFCVCVYMYFGAQTYFFPDHTPKWLSTDYRIVCVCISFHPRRVTCLFNLFLTRLSLFALSHSGYGCSAVTALFPLLSLIQMSMPSVAIRSQFPPGRRERADFDFHSIHQRDEDWFVSRDSDSSEPHRLAASLPSLIVLSAILLAVTRGKAEPLQVTYSLLMFAGTWWREAQLRAYQSEGIIFQEQGMLLNQTSDRLIDWRQSLRFPALRTNIPREKKKRKKDECNRLYQSDLNQGWNHLIIAAVCEREQSAHLPKFRMMNADTNDWWWEGISEEQKFSSELIEWDLCVTRMKINSAFGTKIRAIHAEKNAISSFSWLPATLLFFFFRWFCSPFHPLFHHFPSSLFQLINYFSSSSVRNKSLASHSQHTHNVIDCRGIFAGIFDFISKQKRHLLFFFFFHCSVSICISLSLSIDNVRKQGGTINFHFALSASGNHYHNLSCLPADRRRGACHPSRHLFPGRHCLEWQKPVRGASCTDDIDTSFSLPFDSLSLTVTLLLFSLFVSLFSCTQRPLITVVFPLALSFSSLVYTPLE